MVRPDRQRARQMGLRARMELIKSRWPQRLIPALLLGVVGAAGIAFQAWTGYRKFSYIHPQQPLRQALLMFPVWAAAIFAVVMIWPWRIRDWDGENG